MKRFLPIVLAACGAPEPQPVVPDPSAAQSPAPVEAPEEPPTFPGVITSRTQKVLSSEFAGRIEKVFVHQRQRVKAGEVVAKIDDTELKGEIDQLVEQEKSQRAEAGAFGAQAASARQQAKTERILYNRGFQSRNAVGTATARYQEAGGQSAAASSRAKATRAKITQLRELLEKSRLAAPIDGVVTTINAKEGEGAQKGTPILRVFDDRDLIIRFAVPKEHKHLVQIGSRVQLILAGTDQQIWARIEKIADEEPPITFAVVEADIDDSKLRPDEIQVASEGRVRIAEAQPAQPGANR